VSTQGWLLLLAALLQQAPSAAKLQLLEQRGTLLLQLLYQAMLDGECGYSSCPEEVKQAVVEQPCELFAPLLGESGGNCSNSFSSLSGYNMISARPARPVGLVLLILQSLLYKPVHASVLVGSLPLNKGCFYTVVKVHGLGEKAICNLADSSSSEHTMPCKALPHQWQCVRGIWVGDVCLFLVV
jgi:hypothetical protein